MNDFTLFLGKFLTQGTAIASLAPSSRWLSRTTVRNIDWAHARALVELGAGTGPITPAGAVTVTVSVEPQARSASAFEASAAGTLPKEMFVSETAGHGGIPSTEGVRYYDAVTKFVKSRMRP